METAIILASFGVIDEKVREKTTDALFNEIVKEFPQNEVVQAYTSKFIIKKLGGKLQFRRRTVGTHNFYRLFDDWRRFDNGVANFDSNEEVG